MNWKRTIVVSALILCSLAFSTSALAQAKTHHVIFALTSGDEADWNLTLGNMRNLLTGFGTDPYEVELVAFGPGIVVLRSTSSVAADIQALQAKHVHFMACENSMRKQHLTVADLITGVQPVPAGIIELVTKQEQGWIYIKGGR